MGLISLAVAATVAAACTSKYNEKSPDAVSAAMMTPEEKIERNKEAKESLRRLKKAIERTERVSSFMNKLMQPVHVNGYSTMDFIKDMIREFEGSIQGESNGQVVRTARHEVTERHRGLIIPRCHVLNLKMVNKKRVDTATYARQDVVTITADDCAMTNSGRPVLVGELIEEERVMKFKANQQFFRDIMNKRGKITSGDLSCTIEKADPGAANFIKEIVCENMNMNVASEQDVYLARMRYTPGNLSLEAAGRISSDDLGTIQLNLAGSSRGGWSLNLKPDEVLGGGTASEQWTLGDTLISADGVDNEISDLAKSIANAVEKIRQRISNKKGN